MDVDEQVMDPTTWARRLVSKEATRSRRVERILHIHAGTRYAAVTCDAIWPSLRGNGDQAFPGWPISPEIEALREEWLDTPDDAIRQRIAAVAMSSRPSSMSITSPARHILSFDRVSVQLLAGILDGQAIFWNVRRQA